ncbi:MAG: hypothetical protein KDD82_03225 [Planctomycetes bacterium]|nr:hypothetical protein [Planctomycetota bacterium]
MADISDRLLKCTVNKGMFSDEVAVTVTRLDGGKESFFVPRETLVEGDRGLLRVKVRQDTAATMIASIPSGDPSSVLAVRSEDLE